MFGGWEEGRGDSTLHHTVHSVGLGGATRGFYSQACKTWIGQAWHKFGQTGDIGIGIFLQIKQTAIVHAILCMPIFQKNVVRVTPAKCYCCEL